MDHNSSALPEFTALKLIQMKKELRNKQNGTGLTTTKLLHLLNVFGKKKSELLELYRLQFASRKPLRRSSKKLLKSKPEKTNEKQQNKRVKLQKA
jgi:hypothetical protein